MSEVESRAGSGFRPSRVAGGARPLPVFSASMPGRAFRGLQVAFAGIPLAAGADKFLYEIADWGAFLAPVFPRALGLPPHQLLYGIGAWEILLGAGIALKPRLFADALGLWLAAIILNLLVQGIHFDMVLFNFGLAAGACALGRLSRARELYENPHGAGSLGAAA